MSGDARIRSVRRLVQELEKEPVPDLDWDGMEQRLLASAGKPSEPRRDVTRMPSLWIAAGVAALAAGAALVWHARPAVEARNGSAVHAAKQGGALDGSTLALGAIVTSNAEAITVDHVGQASWILEPHSRARVVERGKLLSIALDSGAVDVRVVPHPNANEVFAVESGMTRVAAHGTRFHVALVGAQLQVDVSEGIVVVGSTNDRGHTHGFDLPAPSRGAFGLDGATGTVWSASGAAAVAGVRTAGQSAHLRIPAAHKTSSDTPVTEPAVEPSSVPTSSAPPTLERVPTIAEIDDGLEAFQLAANRCFESGGPAASGVRVTVRVTAIVDIAPTGRIQGAEFVPPLAPDAQTCVEGQLGSLSFAASQDGIKIERTLEFTK